MSMNLIVSNKPSPLNKKLIKFFNNNLLNLNKADLIFEFEVAHPKDASSYKKRGITSYPVLIDGEQDIIGVDKIVEYLKKKVSDYNKERSIRQNKKANKTESDQLNDYWKQTLGSVEVDDSGKLKPESDSDEEDPNANVQRKIQAAFAERNNATEPMSKKNKTRRPVRDNKAASRIRAAKPSNSSNASKPSNSANSDDTKMPSITHTLSNMKKSGDSNTDDALMAQFFENQGPSI